MTQHEREQQVLLSLALGPIFPLYGIVERPAGILACECGNESCESRGSIPVCAGNLHSVEWLKRTEIRPSVFAEYY
jgi:hypothetical protein